MSPIKPGTLCLIVQGPRTEVQPELLGRTVTTVRRLLSVCPRCGDDLYFVEAAWAPELLVAGRSNLQPILPPGIDDQIERAIGNPPREVV